jgi:flagellar basal body-associated protein FliL
MMMMTMRIPPGLSRRSVLAAPAAIVSFCRFGSAAAEEARKAKPMFVSLGEFTVNLPDDGGAMAYVIIGITLEVTPEAAGDLNDITPRIKDLVIRRLMVMAAQGMLAPGHTDLVMIKASLFDGVVSLRPDSVREVLITRLLYG